MIMRKGDLFSTDAKCIGHGVNCKGVMGAGIAKAFREKYPENYNAYRRVCQSGALGGGEVFVWPFNDDNRVIFNMASQVEPGANASYAWLFQSAWESARICSDLKYDRLAIPLIGCGIGGLEWPRVEVLLLAIETMVPDFQFEVWKF